MNKQKIKMKLFNLKKLLSNKKTSLLLLLLLLISGALFAKSSINQNKNLDNYKNYYLKGIFSVESEPSIDGEQKYNRYFVIYDNKIFTTLNNINIDDDKEFPNGKHSLKTDLGTKINIEVKNGEIKKLEPLNPQSMKKERYMKDDNCLTAEFLVHFYSIYNKIDYNYIFMQEIWSNKRLRIYQVEVNKENYYGGFNVLIIDNKLLSYAIEGEEGYDDKSFSKEIIEFCFIKVGTNQLLPIVKNSQKCFIKTKNCKIIN